MTISIIDKVSDDRISYNENLQQNGRFYILYNLQFVNKSVVIQATFFLSVLLDTDVLVKSNYVLESLAIFILYIISNYKYVSSILKSRRLEAKLSNVRIRQNKRLCSSHRPTHSLAITYIQHHFYIQHRSPAKFQRYNRKYLPRRYRLSLQIKQTYIGMPAKLNNTISIITGMQQYKQDI